VVHALYRDGDAVVLDTAPQLRVVLSGRCSGWRAVADLAESAEADPRNSVVCLLAYQADALDEEVAGPPWWDVFKVAVGIAEGHGDVERPVVQDVALEPVS
jgi:hypothetical protein